MANDLYSVLGVSKTADTEEIKRAYRKLAAQLHPDRNPGKPDAETKFKAVNQAYTVLSDPAKRALYDEFGEDGLREGFNAENARAYKRYTQGGRVNPGDVFGGMGDAGEGGMGDLFAEIFGRRGGAPGRRVSRRGADWESEITINFAASIKGTTLDLRPRGAAGEPITVRIPPGASDGDRLRVGGQGAAGENGGPPGDLLLVIHVEPHAHFKRDGDDLIIDLPVTPLEAYEGAKVRVPTPEGHISLKLPARSQSGQKIRVKGRGVARRNAEPGDLYVTVQIQLPTGPEAENLLKQLESQMPPDLRKGIEF